MELRAAAAAAAGWSSALQDSADKHHVQIRCQETFKVRQFNSHIPAPKAREQITSVTLTGELLLLLLLSQLPWKTEF
ncbi:hypothetical protein F2P81_024946 [Scophthalmus maximus]|uniref:Uncharacterized protein n=1 Tax=Scophthalmus maximus TaxID=52904 RepID=A0A6A4RS08_SCOMX|nr:hypothetical protein F2P81_024946 [Scophthalmus maximus]